MKNNAYYDSDIKYHILMVMGFVCVVLSIALICIATANQKMQLQIQTQQQYLNQGVLGQQGQQITATIIQEMDNAAASNANIRTILEQYGYRKPAYPSMKPAESEAPKQ